MKAKKWIKDTKIARKMNKNSIVGSKEGWIEVEYEDGNPEGTFTAPTTGTYEINYGINTDCIVEVRLLSAGDMVTMANSLYSIQRVTRLK